jgi:hypothetical protein
MGTSPGARRDAILMRSVMRSVLRCRCDANNDDAMNRDDCSAMRGFITF